MSTHPEFNDLMVEALYGELSPQDRERLEEHLSQCEPCADEFDSLSATLDVMAERERPDLPPSYWESYRREVKRRRAAHSPTLFGQLQEWWREVPALLPQTGPQWAVQGAMAVILLGVGLWLGQTSEPPSPAPIAEAPAPSSVTDLLLAKETVSSDAGRATPVIANVHDVTYNTEDGTVAIRYETVNHITVKGQPGDPTIQRLLRSALLDRSNPASQLNAMQTLERASVEPDSNLVQPLTYLLRKSENPDMRLRALRALRALHEDATLDTVTQSVLVGLLLDTESPTPLRVEALQTLTAGTSRLDPDVLYPVRNDSNVYLRYQARSKLQHVDTEGRMTPLRFR